MDIYVENLKEWTEVSSEQLQQYCGVRSHSCTTAKQGQVRVKLKALFTLALLKRKYLGVNLTKDLYEENYKTD